MSKDTIPLAKYGCIRCERRFYCSEACYEQDRVEHAKNCRMSDTGLNKATCSRREALSSVDPIYCWDFRLKPNEEDNKSPTLCEYTNIPCKPKMEAFKTKVRSDETVNAQINIRRYATLFLTSSVFALSARSQDGMVCGPTYGFGEVDGCIKVLKNFSIEVKLRFDTPKIDHYEDHTKGPRYQVGTVFDFRSASKEAPNHRNPIIFDTKPMLAVGEREYARSLLDEVRCCYERSAPIHDPNFCFAGHYFCYFILLT